MRTPTGDRNEIPRDIMPNFAKLVRDTRAAKQWSQRELARRANLSAMCVCDLEGERRSPSLRIAAAVAKALELPVPLAELAVSAEATAKLAARRKRAAARVKRIRAVNIARLVKMREVGEKLRAAAPA